MVPKNICILLYQQVESVEGDNAETPSYEYNLGIRAELEVKKSDLLRMICQLYNCKVFLPRFKGIILTNQSLVLQRISRRRSGSYTCQAVNDVGRGASQPIYLNVKCK